jgi:FMN phosphatase YigB (HAD superfamily)
MGIKNAFDFIITSSEIKSEKPYIKGFRMALENAGHPSRAYHVGNSFSRDVLGAVRANITPVYLRGKHDPSIEQRLIQETKFSRIIEIETLDQLVSKINLFKNP